MKNLSLLVPDILRRLWKRVWVRFVFGIITTLLGVALFYFYDLAPNSVLVVTGMIIYPFVLVFVLMSDEARVMAKERGIESEKAQREEITKKFEQREKDFLMLAKVRQEREYRLMQKAFKELADVMRDKLVNLYQSNDELENLSRREKLDKKELLSLFDSLAKEEEKRKYVLTRRALGKICETFEADPSPLSDTEGLHSYFKATIFEPIQEELGKGVLERTCEYYPPTMHPQTSKIKEEEYPWATAIRSWRKQKTEILENIKKEAQKAEGEQEKLPQSKTARWADFRKKQHENYESMVSVPIIKGRPLPAPEIGKVIAILTVDTNRKAYFKENDTRYEAFLAHILHPYCILIALFYELETFHSLLKSLCEKLQ